MTLNLSRQANLIRGNPDISLCIIGAGGIGSNAAYVAASLGVTRIAIYDNGILEEPNVAPGWFSMEHIGKTKVEAIGLQVFAFTGVEIKAHPVKYTGQKGDYDVVLIGTDTLSSRRQSFRHNKLEYSWWIDGRMGKQLCSVYAVCEGREEEYEKDLVGKNGVLSCGEKATAYITKGHLQGMIGDALARIINMDRVPYLQLWDSSILWRETVWWKEEENGEE